MTDLLSLKERVERKIGQVLATPVEVPEASARLDAAQIAGLIDHTVLKADAPQAQIVKLCEEAKAYGFAAVCVNASYVALCHKLLSGRGPPCRAQQC